MPGAPSSGSPLEIQANLRSETVLGLQEGPAGTGLAGSVFAKNSLYRETCGIRRGG